MRYMAFVMGNADYEAGKPAPEELYRLMDVFIREQFEKGALVSTGGLKPSRHGYKVRARDGRIAVTDGPFAEAREVVGGWAIIEAPDDDAVLDMVRGLIDVHVRAGVRDVDCEIRRIESGSDS